MILSYLHIGFSKCASTFLQAIFKDNCNINFLYKTKLFSLLNEEKQPAVLSKEKINLESDEHIILPSYHPILNVRGTQLNDVEKILNNIKKYSPDIKLILVIRGQADLIRSRYSQYILGGGTSSFEEFIDILNGVNGDNDYYENFYYKIIKIIEEIFGKNYHLILYEDIKQNRTVEVGKLSKFIGVELNDLRPNIWTKRKGLSKSGLEVIRKFNKQVVIEKENYKGDILLKIPLKLYEIVVKLVRIGDYFSKNDKLIIRDSQLEMLRCKFSADNLKLAQFIGRDLKVLGYNI